MINISNNGIISLNRGDWFEFPLFMNQGNKLYPIRYSLLEDDAASVYFSIMLPGQEFQNGLIRKVYSSISPHTSQGDIILNLTSDETMSLCPGKYFFSVKLVYNKNNQQKVATIIPKRMLLVQD